VDVKSNYSHRNNKINFQNFLKQPPKLDFENYPKSIWTILENKSFFKRFAVLMPQNREVYERVIKQADVELYAKDQPIFLNNRVGVVLMGSVEIRRHSNTSLMKPYIVKKATEGDIIGFAEGDANNSASPLTWHVSM
jgi:hypothetical protein